jgi:hypothetical protein
MLMLTLPVVPIPLELNMFCLSQLDYVFGKRLGSGLSSHCGGSGGGWMSGGACHAQLYTGSSLLCPVLFLGMTVKVGWPNIYYAGAVMLDFSTLPSWALIEVTIHLRVLNSHPEAMRKTSSLSRSCLLAMNFAKLWLLELARRNSGKELRSAIETTRSEGAIPGRIVLNQDPKERQTSLGKQEAR